MFYHNLNPNLILGYHGCSESTGESILAGKPFQESTNNYDWLGPGIYFWENNPHRALHYVGEKFKREKSTETPFVVGAVLSLGNCIDTLNHDNIADIKIAYENLKSGWPTTGPAFPKNYGGKDRVFKHLDCAVIRTLHDLISRKSIPPADSLRGLYVEGDELYSDSSFHDKTHVQIAIRELSQSHCIKAVFRWTPNPRL